MSIVSAAWRTAASERRAGFGTVGVAGAGIDAIYVTTLQRTSQTAAPLLKRLGLTPSVEPGLREVYLGEWEGGRYRKMVADFGPVAQRMFAEERWDLVPGAESMARS